MPSVSKDQQAAMAIALAAKRRDIPRSQLRGASKQIASSMSEDQIEDFAKTKTKGLPKKAFLRCPIKIKTALSPRLLQRASERALTKSKVFKNLLKEFKPIGKSHPLSRHLLAQSSKRMGQYSRFSNPKRIPPEIRKLYNKYNLPLLF